MKNNIYFKDSFVKKMLKLVPENLKETWELESTNFSKIIGIVRYENNNLESIYLIIKSVFFEEKCTIEDNFIKFNFINNKFIFDSMYSDYDPITKQNVYPYQYRYDKDFNITAIYKFHNKIDVNTGNHILTIQYKDGKKVKEYYAYDDKFPSKLFEELIKIKVLNPPHWINKVKNNNILQSIWYKIIKLKNNKVKIPDIFTECVKVYGNETLIYYWIK
jgi:hypothetical protein